MTHSKYNDLPLRHQKQNEHEPQALYQEKIRPQTGDNRPALGKDCGHYSLHFRYLGYRQANEACRWDIAAPTTKNIQQ